MSQTLKNLPQKNQAELLAELERIAREQGVGPYNFNEAIHDLTDEWTNEDEESFEEFLEWRQKERDADRKAQEKGWQS
jgi:hypothetical protein